MQKEVSKQFEQILALGRKLVDELGMEQSTDTLARWMAHHIAGLIVVAESDAGQARERSNADCAEAILALWRHRAELPNGRRPFEDIEPIARTIESLDPDGSAQRRIRLVLPDDNGSEVPSESENWLTLAKGLDYSARLLIADCLSEAAAAVKDRSAEWVKLAEQAGIEDGALELVVRFASKSGSRGVEHDPHEEARRKLRDRLQRLESFVQLAQTFAAGLRSQLDALPAVEAIDGAPTKPRQES